MMKQVNLNGQDMTSQAFLHQYLKINLALPYYYGMNLDALYDVLSVYDKKLLIVLTHAQTLIENLGDYGRSLIEVFEDVNLENPNIQFIQK